MNSQSNISSQTSIKLERKQKSEAVEPSLWNNNTESPSIQEMQNQVHHWIKTVGVRYFDEMTNTAILMEEVGEVARLMARTYGDQSFKKSDASKDLGDELSDVLFVLIALANQTGNNLTELFDKGMQKRTQRDSKRHANNEKLQ